MLCASHQSMQVQHQALDGTDLHEGLHHELELHGRVLVERRQLLEPPIGEEPPLEHRVDGLVDGDGLVTSSEFSAWLCQAQAQAAVDAAMKSCACPVVY